MDDLGLAPLRRRNRELNANSNRLELIALIQRANKTQTAAAELLGIKHRALAYYLSGDRSISETVIRLARLVFTSTTRAKLSRTPTI